MNESVEILLVEDNPDDVALTLHAFQTHKLTNRIQVVRDGEEALDFVFCRNAYASRSFSGGPRVILLDLKLPKIDGLEVLRAIKEDERTQAIPVVILTSSKEESDIAAGYSNGVNSYMVKPVDFDQFVDSARVLGLYWLLLNKPPPSRAERD